MTKDWDRGKAAFRKLDARAGKLTLAEADKRAKKIKAAVALAWKAEDRFQEAVEAAAKAGVTGKKLADFLKDKGCKSSLAAFTKASAAHRVAVKALTDYCDEAGSILKEARKVETALVKEMKKSKASLGTRENARFLKDVADRTSGLETIYKLQGKMTAPELLYGANFQRLSDSVFKKASGQGKPKPKVAAKAEELLDPKHRVKNARTADKLSKQIMKLCDAVTKGGEDAGSALAQAREMHKDLKDLAGQYLQVKKKAAEKIKAAKDRSQILRAMATILKADATAGKALLKAEAVARKSAV